MICSGLDYIKSRLDQSVACFRWSSECGITADGIMICGEDRLLVHHGDIRALDLVQNIGVEVIVIPFAGVVLSAPDNIVMVEIVSYGNDRRCGYFRRVGGQFRGGLLLLRLPCRFVLGFLDQYIVQLVKEQHQYDENCHRTDQSDPGIVSFSVIQRYILIFFHNASFMFSEVLMKKDPVIYLLPFYYSKLPGLLKEFVKKNTLYFKVFWGIIETDKKEGEAFMTNSYETVNDVLVKLFKEIMGIEEKALITSEYKDISVNDMHVIEAIGIHEKKNMSAVAKALSVTVGTVTIAINNLVKKGYVKRVRSEKDRRIVLVSLSAKGERAYNHHRMFHDRMVLAVLDGLNKEETEVLMKVLGNLQNFFRNYEHTDQAEAQ